MTKKKPPVFVSPDKKTGDWNVKQGGKTKSTHDKKSDAFEKARDQAGALGVGGKFFTSTLKSLVPGKDFVKRSVVVGATNAKNFPHPKVSF